MTANEILEMMKQYSLTLRCLPDNEVSTYTYSESNLEFVRQQGLDYEITEYTTNIKPTPEQFKNHLFHKNSGSAYINADGYLVRLYIKYVKQCNSGWIAKIDNSHNATQVWGKTDFHGKTPEEAISKAIEYIDNKNRK